MSYFGKNIRKIRTLKKISQAEFADIFQLTRASIGAYEEGRAEAKVDTIVGIAKYFSISVDSLLCKELTINEISHFNLPEDSIQKPAKNEVPTEHKYLVPYISTDRFLDYIAQTKDQKKVDEFPNIMLPWLENGTHCAFEHWGSEMHTGSAGLQHSEIVIGLRTPLDSKELIQGKVYTLVTERNILSREFQRKNGDKYTFTCFNPLYEGISIASEQIIQCWEVIGKISKLIEKPSQLEERLYKLEKQFEKTTKKK